VPRPDYERLDKVHAAATKGKWSVWTGSGEVYAQVTSNSPGMIECQSGGGQVCNCEYAQDSERQNKRNAKWIAVSKTSYPSIRSDVRRLEQALEEIKAFGDACSRTVAREALSND